MRLKKTKNKLYQNFPKKFSTSQNFYSHKASIIIIIMHSIIKSEFNAQFEQKASQNIDSTIYKTRASCSQVTHSPPIA